MSEKMSDGKKNHRREDILAYKQGFLTDEERAELEAHMKDCRECQQTLEQVSRFLPALQEALAPPTVSAEVLLARAKAMLEEKKAKRRIVWMRLQFGGLALAACAAAVFLLVRQPGGGVGTGPVAGHQEDAGEEEHRVAAPRPMEVEVDGGMDGGVNSGERERSR